jgi:hypothetical protein
MKSLTVGELKARELWHSLRQKEKAGRQDRFFRKIEEKEKAKDRNP